MFEFYGNYSLEVANPSFWIPIFQIFIQLITLCIAIFALRTALKSLNTSNQNLNIANTNLAGVSRTQSVQSHMNLITLENEVRKNIANRTIANYENSKATDVDRELLGIKENNAFMLYFASVDKLASLVKTDYLKEQFKNRDWKNEYYDIFDDARTYANDYRAISLEKSQKMIQNIIALLDIWDKENLESTKNIQKIQVQ